MGNRLELCMSLPTELSTYLTGVWQMGIEIADELFDIAEELDKKRPTVSQSNCAVLA